MPIELPKEAHKEAVASIERYLQENMEEKIGNIAAGGLLGFFLEEIGPAIYNKAVADVQERMQERIAELDIEVARGRVPVLAQVRPAGQGPQVKFINGT